MIRWPISNGQPCPQPEDDEPAESKDGNSSRGTGQESKAEETEYELNLAFSVELRGECKYMIGQRATYNAVVLEYKYYNQ